MCPCPSLAVPGHPTSRRVASGGSGGRHEAGGQERREVAYPEQVTSGAVGRRRRTSEHRAAPGVAHAGCTGDLPAAPCPSRAPGPGTPRSHHHQGGGRPFAPVALRQVRTIRQGALPGMQLARPLRKSFEDLGGTFMKFGQIIASSPGLFGDDVADEFRACLDTGPASPFPRCASGSRRIWAAR